MIRAGLFFWLVFGLAGKTHGCEIPESKAVHCLLGEVRGEYAKHGYRAFLAQAEALRNRGRTAGVYGCRATFSQKDIDYMRAKNLFDEARRAWHESKDTRLTEGADHWGSVKYDKAWIKTMEKTMVFTVQIGDHRYYRRKK